MINYSEVFEKAQNITVSTQKIREKSRKAGLLCQRLINNMEFIENTVEKTKDFYSSNSFYLLYELFKQDMADCKNIRKQIYSQIRKLDEIAALYDDAELSSKEQTEALPNSIIK